MLIVGVWTFTRGGTLTRTGFATSIKGRGGLIPVATDPKFLAEQKHCKRNVAQLRAQQAPTLAVWSALGWAEGGPGGLNSLGSGHEVLGALGVSDELWALPGFRSRVRYEPGKG